MVAYSGQSMAVDFAINALHMIDRIIREVRIIIVFVTILLYSQRSYAEGMISAKEPRELRQITLHLITSGTSRRLLYRIKEHFLKNSPAIPFS